MPSIRLRLLVCIPLALWALVGRARADDNAGVALLFAKNPGALSAAERQEIYKKLGLKVGEDGRSLVDESCGQEVSSEVEIKDLDGDGVDEVLITYGNTCMSGMAGSSVILFIRDQSGHYRSELGFPGVIAETRPPKGGTGYPDFVIGGPGFCFPVWHWNGKAYVHLRDEAQEKGGCAKQK
ncbi:MAG: hypothetical protein SF182_23105 [Deltaproteobacteria bacterium]|nr:hypothetical protein [Deltaproteobacteria bacterium]